MSPIQLRTRRALLLAASGLCGCGAGSAPKGCASLKGQTIRWVVPLSPGGSFDVYSRLLETAYERQLGAEILITNEPGAGGVLGAKKLRDAKPDGKTLGILNAPGLLSGLLAGEAGTPNPTRDFTVIGRLGRSRSLLVTGANSSLRTVDDLISRQRIKPLALGITGAASNTLLSSAATSSLLGLHIDYITGYNGSREEMLAAMRGEVDLLSANYETLQTAVEAGDLRVLVQIADTPVSTHPAFAGGALLAGPDGLAARRAEATGRTRAQAMQQAQALIEGTAAGMVVAAPSQLPLEIELCLRTKFNAAVKDPGFLQSALAARRTLDLADAETTLAALASAEKQISYFAPVVRDAIARIRK